MHRQKHYDPRINHSRSNNSRDPRIDPRRDRDRFAIRGNNSRNFYREDSAVSFSTSGRSRDGGRETFRSSIHSSGNSSRYFPASNNRSEKSVGASASYREGQSERSQCSTNIKNETNNTSTQESTPLIFSNYSLRQSNLFQLALKQDTDLLKLTFLYAIARMIYEEETDQDVLVVVMAAEFASEFLHSDRLLYGTHADAYFVKVMEKAVRDPRFIDKVCVTETLRHTLAEYNLPKQFPTLSPVPLTGEQYMHILQILSSSLQPNYENCDLVALLTALIPCLQLDGVSNGYINRVVKVVKKTLDLSISVNIKSCRLFYSRFLCDLTDDEIDDMFAKLRNALPQNEELKNILKRTPGGGLLPIVLIGRALEECQDFPWAATMKLYEDDWRGVDLAIREINYDRMYGYKAIKSPRVDPQNYENLAWLAKTLCTAKLKDEYDDFDDWISVPKKKNEAMKLIEDYLNGKFGDAEKAPS